MSNYLVITRKLWQRFNLSFFWEFDLLGDVIDFYFQGKLNPFIVSAPNTTHKRVYFKNIYIYFNSMIFSLYK